MGNSGNDNNSLVRRPDDKSIIHWGLKRTYDVHENYIDYEYQQFNGVLYPSKITYTNSSDEKGIYTVKINLKANNDRNDFSSSYRLGVSQIDNQQIDNIEVYYQDEILKKYSFEFIKGERNKSLLYSITEYDGNLNKIGTHKFDYFNDVKEGYYGDEEIWNTQNDDKALTGILAKNDFLSDMNALNGSKSESKITGAGLTLGTGLANALSVHGGYSYTRNKSESYGLTTMCDINGDGLPDKIFTSQGKLFYRRNSGNKTFGPKTEIKGLPVGRFSENDSKSNTNEFNASVGINVNPKKKNSDNNSNNKKFGAGCGLTKEKTTSKDYTLVYIQDFNGDGLVDIVYAMISTTESISVFRSVTKKLNPKFIIEII